MAHDYRGRVPPRDHHEESHYGHVLTTTPSLAGPPPAEDRESRHHAASSMAGPVSLPPLSAMSPDYAQAYGGRPGPAPSHEPRQYSASPTDAGGNYPTPSSGHMPLPSVQSMTDPRGQDPRAAAHDPRQQYRQAEPNGYGPQRTHPQYPQAPNHGAYAVGPYYRYADYRGPNGLQPQQPSAPRQRTSIACRYCRKRKIRCSGYQNEPDGKCMNCKKTGNECVFQPVSSSSTTAFVPVSAIPGGTANLPPGTQLYGAFGQLIHNKDEALMDHHPQEHPQHLQHAPPHHHQGPPPPGYPGAPHHQGTPPQLPLPSPTGSLYDEYGRRKRRGEDDHHGPRPGPPLPYAAEDDGRRRSPTSAQSNTPPMGFPPYARNQSSTPPIPYQTPDQRAAAAVGAQPPRRDSPLSASTPTNGAAPAPAASRMSLNNLVDGLPPRPMAGDGRDIDNNMLGRLNRRP